MRKTKWTRTDMFFMAWLFALVFCGTAAAALVTNSAGGWVKHHPLAIGALAMALSFTIAYLLSMPKKRKDPQKPNMPEDTTTIYWRCTQCQPSKGYYPIHLPGDPPLSQVMLAIKDEHERDWPACPLHRMAERTDISFIVRGIQ